jgi:hypothetical protein
LPHLCRVGSSVVEVVGDHKGMEGALGRARQADKKTCERRKTGKGAAGRGGSGEAQQRVGQVLGVASALTIVLGEVGSDVKVSWEPPPAPCGRKVGSVARPHCLERPG